MTGYYFHNTDIRSTRAHMSQILQTAENITVQVTLELVMPKYNKVIDFETIKRTNNLTKEPKTTFLKNFGIQSSSIFAMILFNIPATLFLCTKKIKKEVDFVYVRSNLFLPLAFVARLLFVPIFYEIHRKPIGLGEQIRENIMCPLVSGMIVISRYLAKHYRSYKKKILVAHDGVSLERFGQHVEKNEARKQIGLDMHKSFVLYAGTVRKLKGIDYLIEAAIMLPKVDFLLVGPIEHGYENQTYNSNIKFLGKKEQKDLPILLHAADILVIPHPKGEYSQSPMKLFEYMASRRPIVASRLPSISEVLNDKNAVLVEPENGEALARGIERVLSDANHSQALVEKAYNDVKNYTWENRGIAIAEFMKKTIITK